MNKNIITDIIKDETIMKKTLFILFTFLAAFRLFAATEDTDFSAGVDRYAIYIGCNDGGKERDRLLYAGSDAQSFQKIMSEIGGVQDSNSFILIDPSKDKIDDNLDKWKYNKTTRKLDWISNEGGKCHQIVVETENTPFRSGSFNVCSRELKNDKHEI